MEDLEKLNELVKEMSRELTQMCKNIERKCDKVEEDSKEILRLLNGKAIRQTQIIEDVEDLKSRIKQQIIVEVK